jgi:predicted DNA-binding transcriptional regulator AlpA
MSDLSSSSLLNTQQAAAYLGIGASTLERYRCTGGGPVFMRVGDRAVRYRLVDLNAWLRPVNSTSETSRQGERT